MNTKALLEYSLFLQTGMAVSVLAIILFRRVHRIFPQLTTLLLADACICGFSLVVLFFRKSLHISIGFAYPAYFYATWIFGAIFLILRLMIVYSVFAEAMRPMAGLHQAGKLVFRWVGVVSSLVALALVAGPDVFTSVSSATVMFSHLQQGVSVLTLCLLVFVCFTARPLGLTFRSHLFGVSLGLGVTATVELVQAAWLTTNQGHSLYSPVYLVSSVGFCVALAIWGTYFALPEPERKMILLPTTSPFFFWNRISEILGDSPGHVAVAGFTPSMLAPAEIEMLTAATSSEANVADSPKSRDHDTSRPPIREFHRSPELSAAPRPSLA